MLVIACAFAGGCSEEAGSQSSDGDVAVDVLEDADGAGGQTDIPLGEDVSPDASGEEDADASDLPPQFCKNGDPCDDGDLCTADDFCVGFTCTGTHFSCDDGIACTVDACDGSGGCGSHIAGGSCLIDGVCFSDGDPHPTLDCVACVVPIDDAGWTADDARSCDDGDPCTVTDGCFGGACLGSGALDCDDGNACTDEDCVPMTGCAVAPNSAPCQDANPCSLGDTCVEGICVSGSVLLPCDDHNGCTNDACVAGQGCEYTANQGPCDDGDPCSIGDVCADGGCQGGSGTLVTSCEDGNPCTDADCDAALGCIHLANEASCEDGNACTLDDVCVSAVCAPGTDLLACDDGNGCTDDVCDPGEGCVFLANIQPCDDSDACTTFDTCNEKSCQGGPPPNCDDADVCTDDACDSAAGCIQVWNTSPCADGQPCTLADTCSNGACVGQPKLCNDVNDCTTDACDVATGECVFTPLIQGQCLPEIVVFTPPRGATLDTPGDVGVVGEVTSGSGAIVSMTLNGVSVAVDGSGAFSASLPPAQGMNMIVVEATDVLGNVSRRVQSFYHSSEWTPIDDDDPVGSMLDRGLALWLGEDTIDDGVHDPNDVDDLATIFEIVAGNLDLSSLLASDTPVSSQFVIGLGDVDVYVTGVEHGPPKVNLDPINGGLHLQLILPNLDASLKFTYSVFWNSVTSYGSATSPAVIVDTDLFLSVDASTGEVLAVPGATSVQVQNLNVELDGALGVLANWLIDFFEGSFADQVESAFESEVESLLPAIVSDALESLALNSESEFPPLMEGGASVTTQLVTMLSELDFQEPGGEVGMNATAVTMENQSWPTLGAIGRAVCGQGGTEAFDFETQWGLQIALHDDLFNQLLFGLWWGGGLNFPVDPDAMDGVDLGSLGLNDVVLDVDFMLPPIITSCNAADQLVVQIGDLHIAASLSLGPVALVMDVYTSLEAEASLGVVDGADGAEIGLTLGELTFLDSDIQMADDALVGFVPTIQVLIDESLVPVFLTSLTGGAIGGFPLPAIDLGVIEGVPPGTVLELALDTVVRDGGYTVLQGEVK